MLQASVTGIAYGTMRDGETLMEVTLYSGQHPSIGNRAAIYSYHGLRV